MQRHVKGKHIPNCIRVAKLPVTFLTLDGGEARSRTSGRR